LAQATSACKAPSKLGVILSLLPNKNGMFEQLVAFAVFAEQPSAPNHYDWRDLRAFDLSL